MRSLTVVKRTYTLRELPELCSGFPPGLENREEKYGQGKVRELFIQRALISNKITPHKYIMIALVCVSDCVIYIYIQN